MTSLVDENRTESVIFRSLATVGSELDTYRYLRGGIPVMLVMLAVALDIERVRAGDWLGSISAYYFTGAHAVFIGSVCAMGVLLVVYKGVKPTEDVLLNLAGILAFVVAFVPTSRPENEVAVTVSDVNVVSNAWALVAALVVARAATWFMYRRTGTTPTLEPIARIAVWVQRVVLAAGLLLLAFDRTWFVAHAHGVAAVVLFLAMTATVAVSAFVADKGIVDSANPALYQRIYRTIAVLMLVTLALVVVVHCAIHGVSTLILYAEVALLVEFGIFWVVQTAERWGHAGADAGPAAPRCTERQQRILDAL